MSSVVPEIAVLLARGLGLGVDCRHLLVSGTPDTAEYEVARGQCQQPADNASLIPAKIIERTEHFPIHESCLADSDRRGGGRAGGAARPPVLSSRKVLIEQFVASQRRSRRGR